MADALDRMDALVRQLNDASTPITRVGRSLMSDAQWDRLYDELVRLEKKRAYSGRIPPPAAWARSR